MQYVYSASIKGFRTRFPKEGRKSKSFSDELILNILELQMKSKQIRIYVSSFENYTKYFGVADEKQKSKNLRRQFALLNSLKEAI